MSKYLLSFVPRRSRDLEPASTQRAVRSGFSSSLWTSRLNKTSSVRPNFDPAAVIPVAPGPDLDELRSLAVPGSSTEKLCCDKCDGKHVTSNCPYYKKQRENHPDAQKSFYKKMGGDSTLPHQNIGRATVMRQPGDGSCLFHSLSYGLGSRFTASGVRKQICAFIKQNPQFQICDTPLSDWVRWDSGCTCAVYSSRMSGGAWGGGIEMACASQIYKVNVHVYERSRRGGGFVRISAFDYHDDPASKRTVRVVYQGGVHYDALVI